MIPLCHRDKVVIRKAIRALEHNDRRLDAGLEDPITEYYGSDAASAVYAGHRATESDILHKALRNSRAVRRGRSYNGLRYHIEELATKHRLLKPAPDPWEGADQGSEFPPYEEHLGLGGYEGGSN